jgi:hypothetical protein
VSILHSPPMCGKEGAAPRPPFPSVPSAFPSVSRHPRSLTPDRRRRVEGHPGLDRRAPPPACGGRPPLSPPEGHARAQDRPRPPGARQPLPRAPPPRPGGRVRPPLPARRPSLRPPRWRVERVVPRHPVPRCIPAPLCRRALPRDPRQGVPGDAALVRDRPVGRGPPPARVLCPPRRWEGGRSRGRHHKRPARS